LLKPLHAEIMGDLDSLSSRIAALAQRQDLSSQERATMQGLLAKWAISKSHAMDTIDVGQHDSTLAAPMATMMLGETDDSFEAVNADLQKLSLAVSATAGNTSNQLYFDAERTKSVIILVTLVGFLISSIVVVIVGRSIVRPIESVTDVMQRLSGGEVDVTIDHQDRRDEIGRMVDAIEVFRKNIIEKHEMEQKLTAELGRSVEEMRALAEVGQTVNSTLDLETVLSVIVSKATQLSGTEAGAIYVFSEASLEHQLRATYGMTQSLIDALRDQHAEISNTVALAIERRQPMQTPDLRAERPSVARDIMLEAGYLARLIVPLLAADRIVGALVVRQKAPGEFPKNTITLLQTFAAQSVLAIQNARLFSEIKEARVIAEEATKAKADFLANMSHEIRTPMNAVIGLAHLCLKSDLTAKQRDYVGKIHNAGTSLLSIINDILDFSKIEAGKLDVENVTFEIDALMTNVSTVVAQKIQDKGLELLFDVSSNIPPALLGDPLRLGQVLINLLGNAAKFTERGEIRLTCQLLELGGGKAKLQFSVKDTGVGMTKEQASRLFQAFSQADTSTSRKYGGTGLGLAISKRLVELMDGAIWLNSEPGVGSTFSFTGWFGLSETIGRKAVPMRLGSLKVLVVDDNASAREILDEQLRSIGAEIEQVASGMEAIDAVRRADAGHPFDVILLDWRMPKLDGIETARRIRADRSLKSAPAIIIIGIARCRGSR